MSSQVARKDSQRHQEQHDSPIFEAASNEPQYISSCDLFFDDSFDKTLLVRFDSDPLPGAHRRRRSSFRERAKFSFYRLKGRVQAIVAKKMANNHQFIVGGPSVWIMGKEWQVNDMDEQRCINMIRREVESRIWVTYRYNFPRIGTSPFTSDAGWGCMLRSGQMMMAQALLWHFLSRTWQYSADIRSPTVYAQILRWFVDLPTPKCPYSIHNMLQEGACFGKQLGEWFGPGEVAHMLQRCHDKHILASELCVYVGTDGTLYRDAIEQRIREAVGGDCTTGISNDHNNNDSDLANGSGGGGGGGGGGDNDDCNGDLAITAPPPDNTRQEELEEEKHEQSTTTTTTTTAPLPWRPLVLIIPVRLGVDTINNMYLPALQACIRLPQSLGFMGGKPRSSLYFLGYQEDQFIYLDPHTVQNTVTLTDNLSSASASYHCSEPVRSLPFDRIDPSLAIGFYCRHRKDLETVWTAAQSMQATGAPVFAVADITPVYDQWDDDDDVDVASSDMASPAHSSVKNPPSVDDDFVLL